MINLPEVVSDGLAGRGGFADQQAVKVVVIDGRSAAIPCTRSGGHFAGPLAAGIVAYRRLSDRRLHTVQPGGWRGCSAWFGRSLVHTVQGLAWL